MFINFKDFKGKTEEAINKLLNDLKRDGLIKVNFSTKAPRSFVAVAVEQEEQKKSG